METIELYLSYFFNPWLNETAYRILNDIFVYPLLITIILLIYFNRKNKENAESLFLSIYTSCSILFGVFFYWYVFLFYSAVVYYANYYEIKGDNQLRETWQKNIKLSVALTVAIPVITIIVFQWLGFGYKLFP